MNPELIFALLVAGVDPDEVEFNVRAFTTPPELTDPNRDTPALQTVVIGASALERKAAEWSAEGYSVAYGLTADQAARLNALTN